MRRYKQEVEKLTAQTDSDRLLLQELIRQKEELERDERSTTERVWQTRRAILDKKAEVEALEQQRGGVDRESAIADASELRGHRITARPVTAATPAATSTPLRANHERAIGRRYHNSRRIVATLRRW